MSRPSGRTAASWAAAALLAGHALLAWLCRGPGIVTAEDDAMYLLLGRALRHLSYQELWNATLPVHAQYPPGYPALLAIAGWPFGDRYDWLVLLNIAASVLTLFLVWRTVRRLWSDSAALLALASLAVNPWLVERAGMLMSETLFMLLGIAAVVRLAREQPDARDLASAGALAIGAALTRSVGVALLPAIGLLWVMQRRWKSVAALALASALTVGLWLAWTVVGAEPIAGQSYVGDVARAVETRSSSGPVLSHLNAVVANAADYASRGIPLGMPMPTVPGILVDNIAGSLVAALGLVAGFLVLWKKWRAAALHLAASLCLLVMWPYVVMRFLIPLIPLLVTAMLLGIGEIAGLLGPRWRLAVTAVLATVLTLTGAAQTSGIVQRRGECERGSWPPADSCMGPDRASFFAAVRYVSSHTEPAAVVLSGKGAPLFYYSGRRTLDSKHLVFADSSAQGVRRKLLALDAPYLLLGSLQAHEPVRLSTRLALVCDQLALEAQFPPRTYLFRVLPAPAADSTACRAVAAYQRANFNRDFMRDR